MVAEHYKVIHNQIVEKFVDDDLAGKISPTFPRSANRYGIKFPDHATASEFLEAFKAHGYEYNLRDTNELIRLRAQWPTTADQQARGGLFRDIFAVLNQGPLKGHLRLSYPRGRRPRTQVSVELEDGSLEDIVTIEFSDYSESPSIVGFEAGKRMNEVPEILAAARAAAGFGGSQTEQGATQRVAAAVDAATQGQ